MKTNSLVLGFKKYVLLFHRCQMVLQSVVHIFLISILQAKFLDASFNWLFCDGITNQSSRYVLNIYKNIVCVCVRVCMCVCVRVCMQMNVIKQ